MKLLTHNILKSNVKGVKVGFPLAIKATQIQTLNVPFNPEFVRNMLPRLEYAVLQQAAEALGFTELPTSLPPDALSNEDFLRRCHHALNNIDVVEGELVCRESGRVFPIKNGIPNMLLREDEI